ncbi:MAG TPA: DinB family protein [Candidatus Acidoferrales bacterium]|nr:DinB family protein [Candidatus Acidoferrales bacterium]
MLSAAERCIRQIPAGRLNERAIENRPRSIRQLGHHIFRIAEAFLEVAAEGAEYSLAAVNFQPKEEACTNAGEIAAYGDRVIERLKGWWAKLEDKSCRQNVKAFYGAPSLHRLLERSTWHSAQHARQLIAVLERLGIDPAARLSPADLAGLPLPEGLWE